MLFGDRFKKASDFSLCNRFKKVSNFRFRFFFLNLKLSQQSVETWKHGQFGVYLVWTLIKFKTNKSEFFGRGSKVRTSSSRVRSWKAAWNGTHTSIIIVWKQRQASCVGDGCIAPVVACTCELMHSVCSLVGQNISTHSHTETYSRNGYALNSWCYTGFSVLLILLAYYFLSPVLLWLQERGCGFWRRSVADC